MAKTFSVFAIFLFCFLGRFLDGCRRDGSVRIGVFEVLPLAAIQTMQFFGDMEPFTNGFMFGEEVIIFIVNIGREEADVGAHDEGGEHIGR